MIEIRVPKFPECAEPCGACFNADDSLDVFVAELLVRAGETVDADDVVAVVETNKTSIEVTVPRAGTVREIFVRRADSVTEDALLMTVDD
ncbi:MAG TPA: biotin/lipoyl-containing protein [Magnetospirillum sp.]|nr:biotin/lipoyl-containing protein [Magnetospirillum sp.]